MRRCLNQEIGGYYRKGEDADKAWSAPLQFGKGASKRFRRDATKRGKAPTIINSLRTRVSLRLETRADHQTDDALPAEALITDTVPGDTYRCPTNYPFDGSASFPLMFLSCFAEQKSA